MNFLDFVLTTYDATFPKNIENLRSPRIPYIHGSGREGRCRVTRGDDRQDVLPNIIGGWFLRYDKDQSRELHCASVLVLLKPWRSLGDLSAGHDTFSAAYDDLSRGNPSLHDFVNNIHHYYLCHDSAKQRKKNLTAIDDISQIIRPTIDLSVDHSALDVDDDDNSEMFENQIEFARLTRIPAREALFAVQIVADAEKLGIFVEDENLYYVQFKPLARIATPDEATCYEELYRFLSAMVASEEWLPNEPPLRDNGGIDVSTCIMLLKQSS